MSAKFISIRYKMALRSTGRTFSTRDVYSFVGACSHLQGNNPVGNPCTSGARKQTSQASCHGRCRKPHAALRTKALSR
jgi:hypothetical protein